VVDNLQIGGPQKAAVVLTRGLRARGHDARVAHLGIGGEHPLAAELEAIGAPPLDLRIGSLLDPRPTLRLASYLRGERIDVVHTDCRYASLIGRAAAALAQRPVVSTVHSIVETDLGWRGAVRRHLDYLSARMLCAVVITVAEAQRRVYDHEAGPMAGLVETHPSGIDTQLFRPDVRARARIRAELDLEATAPLFATVAILRPGKGLDHFLEAAVLVRQQSPEARFVVVGDGDERVELEGRATELGLSGVVRFLGLRSDVAAVLAASDVYVHPSLFEAYPTAILEAMAVGLPVVATAVGGVPEMVSAGRTGLLVAPARIDQLAEAMVQLLEPELRRALGAAGRAWVEEHASMRVWLDDLEALYRRVVGRC
jgi:glycosyltransferase involved in cell wall biosynthesis